MAEGDEKVRVWRHWLNETGPCCGLDPEGLVIDLDEEAEAAGVTIDLDEAKRRVQAMTAGDSLDFTETGVAIRADVVEMTQAEFDALPEFEGW